MLPYLFHSLRKKTLRNITCVAFADWSAQASWPQALNSRFTRFVGTLDRDVARLCMTRWTEASNDFWPFVVILQGRICSAEENFNEFQYRAQCTLKSKRNSGDSRLRIQVVLTLLSTTASNKKSIVRLVTEVGYHSICSERNSLDSCVLKEHQRSISSQGVKTSRRGKWPQTL